jgi:hypothetical protein
MMRKQPAEAIVIGGVILCLIGLGAIALVSERPSHPARATITHATFVVTRYTVYEQVEFRSADGRRGNASFLPSEFPAISATPWTPRRLA